MALQSPVTKTTATVEIFYLFFCVSMYLLNIKTLSLNQ